MISKELMEILVCPVDKGKLKELPEYEGLKCTICGRLYPVKEGIPIMLEEEAILPEEIKSKEEIVDSYNTDNE